MTLKELEEEIALLVNDSSLSTNYRRWINEAVLAVADDLALPALKLMDPVPLEITEDSWTYALPSSFLKQVFRVGVFDGTEKIAANYVPVKKAIDGFNTLHDLDPAHTLTADHPEQYAVLGRNIGVFPKAVDTIYLWFYEKPKPLMKPTESPDCINESYQHRVIIPKVMIKNFRILQDMIVLAPHQSITFWQTEYSNGLYGVRGGDMGLVNVIARENPPRRHGGRDPIFTGWGYGGS
jgi:hypothetical protein